MNTANLFISKYNDFFEKLGHHKKMVLSTSLNDKVTSRMMSMIIINQTFYFQTDLTFRKYRQIQENPYVSLCIDNIQIDGICRETGKPIENPDFCDLFSRYFPGSYQRYTRLANERLFAVEPFFAQQWVYRNDKPFVDTYDLKKQLYAATPYECL